MNLINDLENDLALAFLVEKKHTEKIDSRSAQILIAKVKKLLQNASFKKEAVRENSSLAKIKTANSY